MIYIVQTRQHMHACFFGPFYFYCSLVFYILGSFIPLALVGYEMIIAKSALRASLAIYHLISNARSWNNC